MFKKGKVPLFVVHDVLFSQLQGYKIPTNIFLVLT